MVKSHQFMKKYLCKEEEEEKGGEICQINFI